MVKKRYRKYDTIPVEIVHAIQSDTRIQKEIAMTYGVSQSIVSRIKNRAVRFKVRPQGPIGRAKRVAHNRRLTKEQVAEIRSSQWTTQKLSKHYGVSWQSIENVRNNVSYLA